MSAGKTSDAVETIGQIKADYLSGGIGKITFHRRASALGFTTDAIRQIIFEAGLPLAEGKSDEGGQ